MTAPIPPSFYLSLFDTAKAAFLGCGAAEAGEGALAEAVAAALADRDPAAGLSAEAAATLLHLVRRRPVPELRAAVLQVARAQRRRTFGDTVAAMVPIEVTSFCASTCRFCGWRADNRDMVRLSITEEAIREQARTLARKGFSHFEIAGGDDLPLLQHDLKGLVRGLKEETSAINPEARVSVCLVPLHEHHYRDLRATPFKVSALPLP